jgi:hypothetical protein
MTTTDRYRRTCEFAVRRTSSEPLLSSSDNDKRAAAPHFIDKIYFIASVPH